MRNLTPYCLFCIIFLMTALHADGQTLTVDASSSAQQLIEDVLIGQGVQVSNIQFSGNSDALGSFDGTNSNIGLDSGVIIATGRVVDAEGPNPASDDPGTEFSGSGDSELSAISGFQTFDAAILEFDFVPSSDSVRFRYVFASNEYMFWVSAVWNDVFAFLISGPGIVGEQNIALIPGSTTAVTIDNVNANLNSQFYIDNENPLGPTVGYNGFTTGFTALAVVPDPCGTYHIRLAIADAGDDQYDSAVFLEAHSFASSVVSLAVESTFSASNNTEVLIEGCSSMTLTFERSAPLNDPISLDLILSGTATNGVDITNIPNTVNFATGESTVSITFQVLEDNLTEGVETMTIELDQPDPCSTGPAASITFDIEDAQELTIQVSPDVVFTCPQEYTIDVEISGGYADFTYDWSGTIETGASITVFPLVTTTYGIVVTDACNFTALASVTVNTSGYQPLEVSATDAIVCNGDEATLESTVTGGLGSYSYLWHGSGTEDTYTFEPTGNTTITLQVTDDCGISEQTIAEITVDEVNASFTHELSRNDVIQFTNTTIDGDQFIWEFGDDSTGTAEDPSHVYVEPGTYTVLLTVINENGCEDTVRHEIIVYPPLHIYIPNSFTPNDDGVNDMWGVVGEGYLYYDLEIYSRMGQRLHFGRFRDETAWDGKVKGKFVPSGAYIYKVYAEPPIGIEVKESGVLFVLPGR